LGGIQADAMGLGKTLSTLALLLINPPLTRLSHFHGNSNDEAKMPVHHETVVPAIPTANQLSAIPLPKLKRHLSNAGIAVPRNMKKFQVVALFVEALQQGTIPSSVISQLQGPSETPSSSMPAPICTIIVCPVSVFSNWITQIDTHVVSDTFRVMLYQGSRRRDLLSEIQNGMFDILLVSYHTLASEYNQVYGKSNGDRSNNQSDLVDAVPSAKRSKKESIFDVKFYRIVLDEGHSIRSSKTTLFKSVCQIQAERKWILTGTPIVNRCNDLHSLFAFLGVPPLNDVGIFNRVITRRMHNGGDDADLAMAQLRTTMAHVALRRSKATAGIQLTEKTVQLASIEFENGSAHQIVYNALFGSLRLAFQAILDDEHADSIDFKIYNNVFERLLRLRQACCSVLLLTKGRREVALKMWEHLQKKEASGCKLTAREGQELLEKLKGVFSEEEIQECAICLDEMEQSEAVILKKCQHVFCNPCMSKVLSVNASTSKGPCCPLCRQTFRQSDLIKESVATEAAVGHEEEAKMNQVSLDNTSIGLSPKILALLESLKAIKPQEKGVIFSQFTSFLDLVQAAMTDAGYCVTRLDGSMSSKRRTDALTRFSSDEEDSPRFILCSLHAAGTGINLNRANHAFMMDTWFNESIENQAMDRIHRIGQKRQVFVTRFVMKGSVEERMITLQETKSLQAKGSLQKLKADERRKVRFNELRGLLMLDEVKTS
jgi:SWI/SNF-related matrix-associated actin-dependent regulator of chromatin subfamily A3